MTNTSIYQDIALRTDGDIYLGIVGPVRTGKSTFIKRFMECLVIPNIDNVYMKERAKDEDQRHASIELDALAQHLLFVRRHVLDSFELWQLARHF